MVQDPRSESPIPSQSTDILVDTDKEIKESMGAGKRHLLCSDYPDAVACFQEACELLAQKYGQLSEECSDAYYYYGSSLLELARTENGVLGNALKGVPEEDEESDKDDEQFEKPNMAEGLKLEKDKTEEKEDKEKAPEGKTVGKETASVGKTVEKETAPEGKTEEKGEKEIVPEGKTEEKGEKEKAPEESVTEKKSETPSTSKPAEQSSSKSDQECGEDSEENPDDIPNMQLAWEMLDLARVLYKKKEKSKNNSLMVAQCHLKLGELGLEGEQHPQAIADFLECLVIQKEHLAETDRKLAETHYNLGLAYSFERRCDNALEHYQNALDVLETRVDLLEELIESKEGESEKEADTMAECKEVGEIKDLIPDINSKIEDVLSVKKQNEGKREDSLFTQTGETTTGFGAASSSSSSSTTCSTIPVRKVVPSTVKESTGDISSTTCSTIPVRKVVPSTIKESTGDISSMTCPTIPVRKVAPSSTVRESTCDISHLVRRKRASPDEEGGAAEADGDSKKAKQDENDSNGCATTDKNGNGDHKSGDAICTSPEKACEIVPKECDAAASPKKKMASAGDAPVTMET